MRRRSTSGTIKQVIHHWSRQAMGSLIKKALKENSKLKLSIWCLSYITLVSGIQIKIDLPLFVLFRELSSESRQGQRSLRQKYSITKLATDGFELVKWILVHWRMDRGWTKNKYKRRGKRTSKSRKIPAKYSIALPKLETSNVSVFLQLV